MPHSSDSTSGLLEDVALIAWKDGSAVRKAIACCPHRISVMSRYPVLWGSNSSKTARKVCAACRKSSSVLILLCPSILIFLLVLGSWGPHSTQQMRYTSFFSHFLKCFSRASRVMSEKLGIYFSNFFSVNRATDSFSTTKNCCLFVTISIT